MKSAKLLGYTALVATVGVGACHKSDRLIAPIGEKAIRYRAGPCYGKCPVFTVVATPSSVTFDGENYTAAAGRRRVKISAQSFDALAASLEPARKLATDRTAFVNAECPAYQSDTQIIEVIWQDRDGELHGYFPGCREQQVGSRVAPSEAIVAQNAIASVMRWRPIVALVGK